MVIQATQVEESVRAVPFHADDLQIAPKVPGMGAADGQPVPQPCQGPFRAKVFAGGTFRECFLTCRSK